MKKNGKKKRRRGRPAHTPLHVSSEPANGPAGQARSARHARAGSCRERGTRSTTGGRGRATRGRPGCHRCVHLRPRGGLLETTQSAALMGGLAAIAFKYSPTLRRAWLRLRTEAAMCVQGIDVHCVLQFTLIHAAGCALHRRTSRVIHRSKLSLFVRSFVRDKKTTKFFWRKEKKNVARAGGPGRLERARPTALNHRGRDEATRSSRGTRPRFRKTRGSPRRRAGGRGAI